MKKSGIKKIHRVSQRGVSLIIMSCLIISYLTKVAIKNHAASARGKINVSKNVLFNGIKR